MFLVDRDGRVDFVKIVDFGIAKVAPIDGQEAGPRLTRAGSVFGTPEYMAPEQAAGRSDTDGRVDIYALGVIMYEMLTGRVPHKGDTMVRTLAMQMLDPVEPPSKARPDLHISPELEAVVLKALTKKREQRYQTMGELLAALEKVQKDALPPPVGQSVTGSPVYALAPLPGADLGVEPALPPAPLDAASRPSASGGGIAKHLAATSVAISTPNAPTTLPRTKSPTNQPKNEPQFVTSDKPITFEHMLTDGYGTDQPHDKPRRWPMLVILALALGTAVGAVLFAIQGKKQAHDGVRDAGLAVTSPADAIIAIAQLLDAGDARFEVPPSDATVVPARRDASDLVILTDAFVRVRPRGPDAGTGPVLTPDTETHRGTTQVEVLTKPETATVYVGTSYRGPNGVKLEEPLGTKLEVRCQQTGYKPGTVSIVFDGRTDVVLCVLQRIKTCVGTLKNPFDECPDAGTSPRSLWIGDPQLAAGGPREVIAGERVGGLAGHDLAGVGQRRDRDAEGHEPAGVVVTELGDGDRAAVGTVEVRVAGGGVALLAVLGAEAGPVRLRRRGVRALTVITLADVRRRASSRGRARFGRRHGGLVRRDRDAIRLGRRRRRAHLAATTVEIVAVVVRSRIGARDGGRDDLLLDRRVLLEDRGGDHADVARLALLPGVRVVDRREPERRDVGLRGPEPLDADLATGRHDVPALAQIPVLAIDHVEAVDRDHRLDAACGRVRDPDRVAFAGVALDVEPVLLREGR